MNKEKAERRIKEIEAAMMQSDFWQDKAVAQSLIKELEDIKIELKGEDKYDKGSAVMTILSGAGGGDAEDFSRILLEMYFAFADNKGFDIRMLHQNQNNHGGYRNVTIEIIGKDVYGMLKNESGVHRLVRISPFDAKKMRHTSFSMVEVVPKFEGGSEVVLVEDDLKIEFSKSGGPGGQNVNKVQSDKPNKN